RWKDLAKWNGIDEPSQLRIGTRLRLTSPDDAKAPASAKPEPAAGERTHKIAKGDTLSRIAALYLGDASRWREIQRLNGIADPASLTEGATPHLPQRWARAPPPPPPRRPGLRSGAQRGPAFRAR